MVEIRGHLKIMQEKILKIENLKKSFGSYQVLVDVNYELEPGIIASIIGPNGAGKSTFFNLITGYHVVSSGSIFFKKNNITNWKRHKIAKAGISRAFQVSNIYPRLTVYENVRQAVLAQQGKTLNIFTKAEKLAQNETDYFLEICWLTENKNRLGGVLSQGDKKKLELALALAGKPELLLLDEPTAGMSKEETYETMELVKGLNKELGLTILFTEHDISVIFGYAEKLSVLYQGRIIKEGLPEDVRKDKEVQKCYLGEEI